MKIWRDDIVGEDLDKRIWILDFTLTNAEASAAAAIGTLLAAKIATMQPPYGAILALVVAAKAQNILAANKNGNGVGANIHYQVIPPAVPSYLGLIKDDFFPL